MFNVHVNRELIWKVNNVPACIISTAQQAKPKVIGQIDPLRAQLTSWSTLDTTNSALFGFASAEAAFEAIIPWFKY